MRVQEGGDTVKDVVEVPSGVGDGVRVAVGVGVKEWVERVRVWVNEARVGVHVAMGVRVGRDGVGLEGVLETVQVTVWDSVGVPGDWDTVETVEVMVHEGLRDAEDVAEVFPLGVGEREAGLSVRLRVAVVVGVTVAVNVAEGVVVPERVALGRRDMERVDDPDSVWVCVEVGASELVALRLRVRLLKEGVHEELQETGEAVDVWVSEEREVEGDVEGDWVPVCESGRLRVWDGLRLLLREWLCVPLRLRVGTRLRLADGDGVGLRVDRVVVGVELAVPLGVRGRDSVGV